jgi:hypothetical protein
MDGILVSDLLVQFYVLYLGLSLLALWWWRPRNLSAQEPNDVQFRKHRMGHELWVWRRPTGASRRARQGDGRFPRRIVNRHFVEPVFRRFLA